MKRKTKENLTQVALNAFAIAILIIFLFPIYWMAITSFKSSAEIFAKVPTFFPKEPTLNGYTAQLFDRTTFSIWINFRNSFAIAGLTTLISTTLATFSAYGLARFHLKLNKVIMFAFLMTQMLPIILFLSPLFITFKKFSLLNTLWAPVVFTCLHSIPFCVITLRPYFLAIPRELEDAAIIDGCNKFTSFLRVMIPITYPGIIVAAAFSFIWGWGDLMGSLTFIRVDTLYPLTVNMYRAIGEYGIQWDSLMAFAVIITLPVLLIFILLQKYLVTGLTSGAVKG